MHRFAMGEELGRGHFGVVCVAENTRTRALVAVKRVPASAAASASHEVAALVAVRGRSPHVAHLLEVVVEPNETFLVMRLAMGGSLLDALAAREGRPLPPDLVRCTVFGVLHALHALHEAGFMHRDVKPENVVFASRDLTHAVLCDLGSAAPISRARSRDAYDDASTANELPSDGEFPHTYVTTRFYRAPEMVLRTGIHSPYDERVDSWAAGCVAFECGAGRPLFPAKDEPDLLLRMCATLGSPPPSLATRDRVPGGLSLPKAWPARSTFAAFASAGVPSPAPALVSLVDALVRWDPSERLLPGQALARSTLFLSSA